MNDKQSVRRPLASRNTKWAKTLMRRLIGAGVRPNQISVLSLVFAALAGLAFLGVGMTFGIGQGVMLLAAAAFIQLRLLCNLMDGMVAVEGGFRTKTGEIFNELPDRISDAFIMVGAGYSAPESGRLWALGWLAALLSVLTAYVRALGASLGAAQHFTGPMAKPHRMAVLTAACAAMAVFAFAGRPVNIVHPALGIIAAGCVITIVRRIRRILRDLNSA